MCLFCSRFFAKIIFDQSVHFFAWKNMKILVLTEFSNIVLTMGSLCPSLSLQLIFFASCSPSYNSTCFASSNCPKWKNEEAAPTFLSEKMWCPWEANATSSVRKSESPIERFEWGLFSHHDETDVYSFRLLRCFKSNESSPNSITLTQTQWNRYI